MNPRWDRGGRRLRPSALLAALPMLVFAGAGPLDGQHRLEAPSGRELVFPRDSVLSMLSRTRALYDTLEADPRIVYYVGYGRPVATGRGASAAYPWHAVTVRSDTAVRVVTPDNLREADRAYFNYAVIRMRERGRGALGGDTGVSGSEQACREAVEREVRILEAFADGWIVSRTLFGSPDFPPLTEIPFARAGGHLQAYVVDKEPSQLGECAETWRRAHPERMEAYRRWRATEFAASEPDSAAPASDPAALEPEAAAAAPAGPWR